MAIYRITYNNIVSKCRKHHFRRLNFYYFPPEELDFNSLNSLPKFYLQWLECLGIILMVPVTTIQKWDTGFSGGILNFECWYPSWILRKIFQTLSCPKFRMNIISLCFVNTTTNYGEKAIPVLLTFSAAVSCLDFSSCVHKHTVDDAPLLEHSFAPQSCL